MALLDVEIAWTAVDETVRSGRGGIDRAALRFGVHKSFVVDAVGRVEAVMGGHDFFVRKVRRVGEITVAGDAFRRTAPKLISAWRASSDAVADA